jgi:hypothetical protein
MRKDGNSTREVRSDRGKSRSDPLVTAALGSPRSWAGSLDGYRIRRWVALALLALGLIGFVA